MSFEGEKENNYIRAEKKQFVKPFPRDRISTFETKGS